MWYHQGFGMHAKDKYCPMVGGNIEELARDLRRNLSETSIGKSLNIHLLNDEKMIIKGDRPSGGLRCYLRNAARGVNDHGKPAHLKSTDFHMVVSIDELGADLNLYKSEQWKDPLYEIVLETVKF